MFVSVVLKHDAVVVVKVNLYLSKFVPENVVSWLLLEALCVRVFLIYIIMLSF